MVHNLQLCHEFVAVLVVPFDVNARVYCPVEVHTVLLGYLDELGNAVCLYLGVWLAPLVAVPGVILRAINVYIHLVATIELQLALACLVAPWCAVETLYCSAERHVGPVGNCTCLELALLHHAEECLHAVEETLLIVAGNDNLLLGYLHEVTLALCRDVLPVLANFALATYTECYLERCLLHNFGRCSHQRIVDVACEVFLVGIDLPLCRSLEQRCLCCHLLWNGIYKAYLCGSAQSGHKHEA